MTANPFQRVIDKETTLDLIRVAVRQTIAAGLFDASVDIVEDIMGRRLTAELNAYVYGKNGTPARVEQTVTEPDWPRWVPRWLRERWSVQRRIVLDAQPFLVWPDADYAPPSFGNPVRHVRFHSSSWQG